MTTRKAANHTGWNVEQMFEPHGYIPRSEKPHLTNVLANDELTALASESGERRVMEALELHPREAARVARARVELLASLVAA